MINLNEQLDKIISKQLSDIAPMIDAIEDGEQKEYIKNAMKQLRDKRTLDPLDFVEGFSKVKGEQIDIDKIREMVKNKK
tara:strand:- start:3745 stop:3981 length:237 start_codon:yes stop_codon:yes gene_type:complete